MKSLISNFANGITLKLAGLFLAVEFVDELVDSFKGTSWPLIRSDLSLSYVEVGMLLAAPHVFGCFIELLLGVLADHGHRSRAMILGGVFFAASLLVIAIATSFPILLAGLMIFNPASGAFVSLSQASLMDVYPTRREQMMARWTLAGTLSHLVGPIIFVALAGTAIGWRACFVVAALAALCCLIAMIRLRNALPVGEDERREFRLKESAASLAIQMAKPSVLKWLVSLELADLMLDVLTGFVALYLVDAIGMAPERAALLILVRAGAAVIGELAVIAVLEHIKGVNYLVWSSALAGVSYVLFLNSSSTWLIATSLSLVTICTSGWYSVLKANLYGSLPNRSGAVMAIAGVTGLIGGFVPLILGLVAEWFGLTSAMWIAILGALSVFGVSFLDVRKARKVSVS